MPLPSQQRASARRRDDDVFRILTVCSGNICRSPLLEQLLRQRLGEALPGMRIEVESAGTMAIDGDPMDAEAAGEAHRLGVTDAEQHRARRLREPHVERADLVLAMAKEHRSAAAGMVPSANGRAFTAVEFATLLTELVAVRRHDGADGEDAGLEGIVDAAHRMRGIVASARKGDLDIVDPYRRGMQVHRESADATDRAAATIAASLPVLMHDDPHAPTRVTLP